MKYKKLFMETALLWRQASKCKRRQVGAIIVKDDRIISIGYNGNPVGYKPIKKEITCPICKGDGEVATNTIYERISLSDVYGFSIPEDVLKQKITCENCKGKGVVDDFIDECEGSDGTTLNSVVHAEANAILFCAKNGISTDGCSIYVTTSPCFECAKMIVQAGLKEVYYYDEYHDIRSLEFLKDVGIKVERIKL